MVRWTQQRKSQATIRGPLQAVLALLFFLGLAALARSDDEIIDEVVAPSAISSTEAGDKPSYIDPASCPAAARQLMAAKRLDTTRVHACRSTRLGVNGFRGVRVDVGPPDDCPSGCIYRTVSAAVLSSEKVVDIPIWDKRVLIERGLAHLPGYDEKNPGTCEQSVFDDLDLRLGVRGTRTGWELSFREPYRCSRFESDSSTVGEDGAAMQRGTVITREWTGDFFVSGSGENENLRWDYDHILFFDKKGARESRRVSEPTTH